MKKRMGDRGLLGSTLVGFLIVVLLTMAARTSAISAQPQVAAGGRHTVGLKSDGSMVAVGRNDDGQCNVFDWNLMVR
jgi:hypothetical protein